VAVGFTLVQLKGKPYWAHIAEDMLILFPHNTEKGFPDMDKELNIPNTQKSYDDYCSVIGSLHGVVDFI